MNCAAVPRAGRAPVVLRVALVFAVAAAAGLSGRGVAAQEADCFDGERLLEWLDFGDAPVELQDNGLYFPAEGVSGRLPVLADVVEVVVESGTGEPVDVEWIAGGDLTFTDSVEAPEPTPVRGGPADTINLAGAGNEGFLVALCYQVFAPPPTAPPPTPLPVTDPPIATGPPPATEPPFATEPPDAGPSSADEDDGGFPFVPVSVLAAAAVLGGWRLKVRRDRLRFRREWELRAEETERAGPCRVPSTYCHKVTADVDVKLRQFTGLVLTGVDGDRRTVEHDASDEVVSALKSARRWSLAGESAAETAERLAPAAERLASDVAAFTGRHGAIADRVRVLAEFEGSSVEVTFHLMTCIGGSWRETDRWNPRVSLKDGGVVEAPVGPSTEACARALSALLVDIQMTATRAEG